MTAATATETAALIDAGADVTDRDTAIRLIRSALKERSGKTWSVTGGRGSDWGWLTITAPPARRVAHFPTGNTGDLPGLDYTEGPADDRHGAYYLSDADRAELATLLSLEHVHHQGVSVAASSDHRREYVARALGQTPAVIATPYWD